MTVPSVEPGKECLAVSPGILDASEAIRKVRTISERPEVRFGEWIIIGNIRPTMRFDHFQIDQQGSDGLRSHAGAAIGVQCEATRLDVLSVTVSAISISASSAVSRGAIIQPTT